MKMGTILALIVLTFLGMFLYSEWKWRRAARTTSNAFRRARIQAEQDRQTVRQIAALPLSTESDN